MKATFAHQNFNVTDLEKSLAFYKENLGLTPVDRYDAQDQSFSLVYLSDGSSNFTIELTWLRDRNEPYNLGDNESHLALNVQDLEAAREFHRDQGVICYENLDLNVYFIVDPDGYWIEIIG